jgi:predicted DNA binding protein
MRTMELRLETTAESRHPTHDLLCQSDELRREFVLSGHVTDGVETLVTYVQGSESAYLDGVRAVPEVIDVEVTATDDEGLFVYFRAAVRGEEERLASAFEQDTIVWTPPTVFDGDGTIEFTLVGHGDDLRSVVDALPDAFAVDDLRFYDATAGVTSVLTDRQYEAVSVAWELGYYDQPRQAGTAEVAAALDVATGTTSELLRRAERRLVRAALTRAHPYRFSSE